MDAREELEAHNAQFAKEVREIAPGVFGAIGFAASNVYMIVGADAVVVIDTTESTAAAQEILARFREVTELPVGTIVYTHSHRDHISGASVFAEGRAVEIVAADNFSSDLVEADAGRPFPHKALLARTRRQFGIGLDHPTERINLGIGPGNRPTKGMGAGYLPPTHRVTGESSLHRHGIDLNLKRAPGETDDHLAVWLEDRKVLFSGDNYYHSFPNLYAIRGTPYRDFNIWADTLDAMIGLGAEVLAPGHTQPLTGADRIRAVLADYRDAIRFLIAQTLAGMEAGLDPVTIANGLSLPPRLREKPWLREFYGKIAWASRAYFSGTLGWFDGNPTQLAELAPADEARRMVALIGGERAALDAANRALDAGDVQWALQLVDRVILVADDRTSAVRLKVQALRTAAERELNAPARNYYLQCARDLEEHA